MEKKEELKAELEFLDYLSKDTRELVEKLKASKDAILSDEVLEKVTSLEANLDALDFTIQRLKKLSEAL